MYINILNYIILIVLTSSSCMSKRLRNKDIMNNYSNFNHENKSENEIEFIQLKKNVLTYLESKKVHFNIIIEL